MKKAKLRDSNEEKIAQGKDRKQPPETGVYVSTKEPLGMRFVVEDVIFAEDEEGFFLVQMIDEASAGDMTAMGDELDPDEWFTLVDQYGLVKPDGLRCSGKI
ncbi:hypothetical protein SAMN05216404_111105 [Nitrosospira multiformis]|uniref:Uncharacterized protein n=1 Tax=Nitrosospira multiformis TaxID=1231 RepID=A0A1H8LZX5_9PROT|nr:hypothetical protein [Nitrosospira multiformis]SEO10667.1 hypothetical protein SAMN05216404_111105 [Nitrosospira multiformis]